MGHLVNPFGRCLRGAYFSRQGEETAQRQSLSLPPIRDEDKMKQLMWFMQWCSCGMNWC